MLDQVAEAQVVVDQVAGTQVLDQVARAQVLDQVAGAQVVVGEAGGAHTHVVDQVAELTWWIKWQELRR